jgi:putative chitinase
MITIEQLQNIYTYTSEDVLEEFLPHLNKWVRFYDINTKDRIRMFLAQIGHESGQLRYTEEIASGKAYEFRKDLGNTKAGDGVKYKGRGLIQITGKSNYLAISKAFNISFITSPELLSETDFAVRSACWWWKEHGLNELADTKDVKRCTKRINGGYNGLSDRIKLYNKATKSIK